MDSKSLSKIAPRIVVGQPIDIDSVMGGKAGFQSNSGKYLERHAGHLPWLPSAANWQRKATGSIAIGIRVATMPCNVVQIASRLVMLAQERKISPVIFSMVAYSGFEQFGFRVECLNGNDEAQLAIFEEELKRFWGIELVLETDEVLALR